jgi:hypothetical protein
MQQLSIDFNPDVTKAYPRLIDYLAARVHQIGKQQKAIAADLDMAPSTLTQKLATPKGESGKKFNLDDLEEYLATQGDFEPIKYLIAKFIFRAKPEELEAQIAALKAQLAEVNSKRKQVY